MSERTNRRTSWPPTVLDNEPACGAPEGWRWGYLSCGCRNDGYGNHINHAHSRLDEADQYARVQPTPAIDTTCPNGCGRPVIGLHVCTGDQPLQPSPDEEQP